MTSQGNQRFDAEAASWDSNPDVRRASDLAFEAILNQFPQMQKQKDEGTTTTEGFEVLEIGCGTGLLSFRVAPYVREIVAVDASHGMIAALRAKLRDNPSSSSQNSIIPKNITPKCIMLEDPDDLAGPTKRFDLVVSHLVLHHIADMRAILKVMLGCLKSEGWVALTDYEDFGPEARKFHPEAKMAGVERHGINRKWLAGLMEDIGFLDVSVSEAFTLNKAVERYPGEWLQTNPIDKADIMAFPFLMCLGRKP